MQEVRIKILISNVFNFIISYKSIVCLEMKFTRNDIKGWLDPYNWMSDSNQWLPHSERVPCTGEIINFPSINTISVQLPTILLPYKSFNFGELVSFPFPKFLLKNFQK